MPEEMKMEFVEFLIKNGNFEKLMAFVELMCVHLDEGEFLILVIV